MRYFQKTVNQPSSHYIPGYNTAIQIVIPEESINLIKNPSFEADTSYCTGVYCNLSIDMSKSRRGNSSLLIQYADLPAGEKYDDDNIWIGVSYYLGNLNAGIYTFSFDYFVNYDESIRVYFIDYADQRLSGYTYFNGNGCWNRGWLSYYHKEDISPIYIRIEKLLNNGSIVTPFNVDGLQLENKPYRTTYFDGDMKTSNSYINDYYWSGQAHNSYSYRSSKAYTGGKIINLEELGFNIIEISGLGMTPTTPALQKTAVSGNNFFKGYHKETRRFSISADITYDYLQNNNNYDSIINILSGGRQSLPQPIRFRFLQTPAADNYEGDVTTLDAVYAGGFEGKINNDFFERFVIAFDTIKSYGSSEHHKSFYINPPIKEARSTPFIAIKSKKGRWSTFGILSANGYVYQIKESPVDGNIYIVGLFTVITVNNMTVNANNAVVYNPHTNTVSRVGSGFNNIVLDVEFLPNGEVYLVGAFTASGSVQCNRVCKYDYNTNTVSSVDGGVNSVVYCVKLGTDGLLYIGGAFTRNSRNEILHRVAVLIGGMWTNAGASNISDDILSIAFIGDTMFVGGNLGCIYSSNGGSSSVGSCTVGSYVYSTCGNSVNYTSINKVNSLVVTDDGSLYAAEILSSNTRINRYNTGGSWTQVGSYLKRASSNCYYTRLFYDYDEYGNKTLIATGDFDRIGDNNYVCNGIVKLVGSDWVPLPYYFDYLAQAPSSYLRSSNGTVYTSNSTTINSVVIYPNVSNNVVYEGDVVSKPIITIKGPGVLKSICNETTGKAIYFNEVKVLDDEVLKLDLSEDVVTFTSNIRGNIISEITPGSDIGAFCLVKGNNVLSAMFFEVSINTEPIKISYKVNYSTIY